MHDIHQSTEHRASVIDDVDTRYFPCGYSSSHVVNRPEASNFFRRKMFSLPMSYLRRQTQAGGYRSMLVDPCIGTKKYAK